MLVENRKHTSVDGGSALFYLPVLYVAALKDVDILLAFTGGYNLKQPLLCCLEVAEVCSLATPNSSAEFLI